MKRWTTLLLLAALVVTATGCKRRTNDPKRVETYDPELDGSVAAMRPVDVDMDLLESQDGVRAKSYTTGGDTGGGQTGTPDGGDTRGSTGGADLVAVGTDPIEEAKTAYQRLREASRSQGPAKLAAYYDKPEAMAFGWLKHVKDAPDAIETIKRAVDEGRLTLPDEANLDEASQMFSRGVENKPGSDIAPMDDLTFQKDGEKVLANKSDGSTALVFVPKDGVWKAQLPGNVRRSELLDHANAGRRALAMKELADGITSGEINEGNVDQKFSEIQQRAQQDIDELTSLLPDSDTGGGSTSGGPTAEPEPMPEPEPEAVPETDDGEDHTGDDDGDTDDTGDDDDGWGSGDGWN